MTATIHDVLDGLRATALDERDKGDKFERLMAAYLRTDPEWAAKFSDVWLWSEWPGRDGRPDTGIDLVAQHRDTDDFAAIQCKFYDADRTVAKKDIDSFVATSSKAEFSVRYLFDTAKEWSRNAADTLEGLTVPVQRIDINYLDDATIDWEAFSWSTPEVVVPTGKKTLRPHQDRALADVRRGLGEHDRGKLVMACGTGKTFTSLRIAEDLVGPGGSVLFLVPSIQLLSQSLREWMANAEVDIRPFAVCSDVRVGRKTNVDDADISTIDLTEPATTDAPTLVARSQVGKHASERMTVVFATYQSIDVIAEAQQQGLAAFDLIVCDEAHRTTGVTLAGQDESHFVKVHDGDYLKASRRLYMTATPRVFGEDVRKKASDKEAILADMGNEATYGPELHRLGFGDADDADLLTDYKVLVLAVDEQYVSENFQQAMAQSGEINLDDAARLLGCWNGLAKHFGSDDDGIDRAPMQTAVAFAKNIKASQQAAASFPVLVDRALQDENGDPNRNHLRIECAHVDGTMGIHERNTHLDWLKADTGDNVCRVLSNARCLSEGVDVPALDAVLFLTPRGSQVDVVQSVGRVMRKAPGKELGYIILPVVVPSGVKPADALHDNKKYQVVWQVLQALRSHDDRFHAMVNSIELNKRKTDRLIIDNVTPRTESDGKDSTEADEQLALEYGFEGFRDAMYARIVKKVGERRYWESWAKDVADIAQTHITRIKGLLTDPESNPAREFEVFLGGLRGNLNENITEAEAVEMLAQHLVTKPVFDALFAGYNFTEHNPVAQTMELMLASLDEHTLEAENVTLEGFYASVRRRVEGVTDAEGKQKVIVDLYNTFFATAFKKTVDKLGIVYTPVEIVDFILRSADEVLRSEFGQGLTDEGVHILDGFTGTGTFMVRLLQLGLIEPHDLARKYANELHANEILLLAYYIAAVNIENAYAEEIAKVDADAGPAPFPGLVLTDTFQSYEDGDRQDLDIFPQNNERIVRQTSLPITVIVGNPPYSAGQDSANDDNANDSYPTLDKAIRATYAERTSARLKNSLYDSYIRAIKWASLRIEDRGVIGFVSNGGWLDSNVADGMRKTLAEEFTSIHVYNLRGNQRSAGELSRKEGGKVFGSGSRATVAITVLVKNPEHAGAATIHYTDIGDYLTADEKLSKVVAAGSLDGLGSAFISPNEHGDWINQRGDTFSNFLPVEGGTSDAGVFALCSAGLNTSRDAWNYNFARSALSQHVQSTIAFYNGQVELASSGSEVERDPTKISWDRRPLADVARGVRYQYRSSTIRHGAYRPFTRTWVYPDRQWNNTVYQLPRMFPVGIENEGFALTGPASHYEFCILATDAHPDRHLLDTGTYFSRWRYEPVEAEDGTRDLTVEADTVVFDGYRKLDNITDDALSRFASAYPDESLGKDDIFFYVYGLLHSPAYRETYAADLKKSLPRIPFVRDFRGYADAGRALTELHLGYESVEPYPLDGLDAEPPDDADPYEFYAVGDKKMKFGGKGRAKDKAVIHYNDQITVSGIPEEAYRYVLGSRSAIEWIIDRYYIKTDKTSGIVNDPNDWSREVGNPRYILDLLARIVTVSMETMKIVDALPSLDILEERR